MNNHFSLDNLNINSYRVDIVKLPNFNFKLKTVDTPSITLNAIESPNPFQKMRVPGDSIEYGNLSLTFIIDEGLYNYTAIINWINGLSFPDSFEQFKNMVNDKDIIQVNERSKSYTNRETSDINIHLLSNHKNSNIKLKIFNAFPISLSGISLSNNNTDAQIIEATVDFSFTGMTYTI